MTHIHGTYLAGPKSSSEASLLSELVSELGGDGSDGAYYWSKHLENLKATTNLENLENLKKKNNNIL